MRYLLDTNACIDLLRRGRGESIRRRVLALPDGDVAICTPVRFELIFGALRSKQREKNLAEVHGLFGEFPLLPLDAPAADQAARIREETAAVGMPIGPYDLLIAGIAAANGLTLVTNNLGEFGRIRGLAVEDWRTG